jgi:hypothetical protein
MSIMTAIADRDPSGYSFFGMGVGRKHTLKRLFSQEKTTAHGSQKGDVCSENALGNTSSLEGR